MKRFLYIYFLISISSCKQEDYAQILFDNKSYHFGNVQKGEIIKATFTFRNPSNQALYIKKVIGGCNCLNPKFPQQAIAPNQDATIEIEYDTHSGEGQIKKEVVVNSNTEPILTVLTIEGFVRK